MKPEHSGTTVVSPPHDDAAEPVVAEADKPAESAFVHIPSETPQTSAPQVSIPVVHPEPVSLEEEPVAISVRTGALPLPEIPSELSEERPAVMAMPRSGDGQPSPFRYNRRAFTITGLAVILMLLIGFGTWFTAGRHTVNSGSAGKDYSVGSNLNLNGVSPDQQLQIGEATQLTVNGRLQVSNTLVLKPTPAPNAPITGQIYFDKDTDTPYYYNGTQFVSMGPQAAVASLGGSNGVIGLGNGLTMVGNQLSLSSAVLQQIAQQ